MSVSSLVQSLAQEKPGKGWKVIGELKNQGIALVKESACNAGDTGDFGSIPGSGRSLELGRQPTAVFLLGESCRLRSQADYHS